MNDYSLSTKKTWAQTQSDLDQTFRLWGVTQWETNYPKGARREGFSQQLEDRKVILSYWKDGKRVILEMAKQDRAIDNLRVLYLAIEAIRLNEKRGIGDVIAQAYLQLTAPEGNRDPYEVIGLPRGLLLSVYEIQYKNLAKKRHPDTGGSAEAFKELNEAIAVIRKEVRV